MEKHYCFNIETLITEIWGRIHVPLAEKCTLHCIYCDYYTDKNITSNIWRPGTVSNTVKGQTDIYEYLKKAFEKFCNVKIVGVSGPGDPLENMEQIHSLVTVMHKYFPQKYLCLCTNGSIYNHDTEWLLNQSILRYITLTVNTMDIGKYPLIYRRYRDSSVPRDMLENQLKIIRKCVNNKVKVKVNSVFMPDVNDNEIFEMFSRLRDEGVSCFNLIPKIDTVGGNSNLSDGYEELQKALISDGYPLMTRCNKCRADYCECGIKKRVVKE